MSRIRRKSRRLSLPDQDLNPLAVPKGWHQLCHLCGMRAKYSCRGCKATFYCTTLHRDMDMKAIHPSICSQVTFINSPIDDLEIYCSENILRRELQVKHTKIEIINKSLNMARQSLYELRPIDALVQITTCLRYTAEVYGLLSTQMVPCHLLKSEAFTRMGQVRRATTAITSAEYILEEIPDCPITMKADYYKQRGLTLMRQGNLEDALTSFAEEIYHVSQAFHPEHLRCAGGFFNLGRVFLKRKQFPKAFEIFAHTVDIWHTLLQELAQKKHLSARRASTAVPLTERDDRVELPLKESSEAREALTLIFKTAVGSSRTISAVQLVKLCYTLALLMYLTDQHGPAVNYLMTAGTRVEECSAEWNQKVKMMTRRCTRLLEIEKEALMNAFGDDDDISKRRRTN